MTSEEILKHSSATTKLNYLVACKNYELTGSDEDEMWVEEKRIEYESADQALADFIRKNAKK